MGYYMVYQHTKLSNFEAIQAKKFKSSSISTDFYLQF